MLATQVAVGQHGDQAILKGFLDLGRPRVNSVAAFVAGLCDPTPWIYFATLPVAIALARRRPRVAVAILVILVGANVSAQLLKPLLAAPRAHGLLASLPHVSAASWPSGHATAAMSLALASVMAAPARWRGAIAAAGAGFAVAVSYSFLTLGWHYPSDVLGGFLLTGTWALAVVGVLFWLDARQDRQAGVPAVVRPSLRQTLTPPGLALAAGLCLAGLVALVRPQEAVGYLRAHDALAVGAPAIAVLGLVVATAVSFAFRR